MITIGFSCFYHDSAACIVKDGKIIFATSEERLSRVKHDNGFPKLAIESCLNSLGIAANEVDAFVFYEKPIKKFDRVMTQHIHSFPRGIKTFIESIPAWGSEKLKIKEILKKEFSYLGPIYFMDHHLSHAAVSYFLSGFEESVVVTVDGVGEWATTTVAIGEGNDLSIKKEILFPDSLGLLYSTITGYLGFRVNDHEYEVMGLSSYGNPSKFADKFKKLIKVYKDGSYTLNMKYFDFIGSDHMPSSEMVRLFGYPIRKVGEPIEKYHKDIAAALQKTLENTFFSLLNSVYREYKIKNLCLAGGVAFNSLMNGKILSKTKFESLYISPDSGDSGAAMGAAIYFDTKYGKSKEKIKILPYLGLGFTDAQIELILKKNKLNYEHYPSDKKLINKTVQLLIDKNIVSWFQGRTEWGPRALGSRSIISTATDIEMKNKINSVVKHREMFRPFAPSILKEYVKNYFFIDKNLPVSTKYMSLVYKFKPKVKKKVPAVVHIDGTGRPQILERSDNPLYYDLIDTYRKKTGIALILNTSFNLSGEPIVNSPQDAIKSFISTKIDYLVIGNYIVTK